MAPGFYRSCAGALTDGFCPQSGLVQREGFMLPAAAPPLVADATTLPAGKRVIGFSVALRLPTNPVPLPPPYSGGTMGAGQWHQFEFMAAEKRKPYNRASPVGKQANLTASAGRFIERSFCVQAKDKLRPTWRPSAGAPQQKCTPSAYGTSPGGGGFSDAML